MLKFYRTHNCPRCTEIQKALEEINYAHKVIMVKNSDEIQNEDLTDKKLPLLIDNDRISKGSDEIFKHLEDLKGFKELWDKFQSDACYCGDDENNS